MKDRQAAGVKDRQVVMKDHQAAGVKDRQVVMKDRQAAGVKDRQVVMKDHHQDQHRGTHPCLNLRDPRSLQGDRVVPTIFRPEFYNPLSDENRRSFVKANQRVKVGTNFVPTNIMARSFIVSQKDEFRPLEIPNRGLTFNAQSARTEKNDWRMSLFAPVVTFMPSTWE